MGNLLSAVTSTGAGTAVDFTVPRGRFNVNVTWTGAPTAVTLAVEASMDNSSFSEVARLTYPPVNAQRGYETAPAKADTTTAYCHTPAVTGGSVQTAGIEGRYLRANLLTLTGGSTPAVSATAVPLNNDVNMLVG